MSCVEAWTFSCSLAHRTGKKWKKWVDYSNEIKNQLLHFFGQWMFGVPGYSSGHMKVQAFIRNYRIAFYKKVKNFSEKALFLTPGPVKRTFLMM